MISARAFTFGFDIKSPVRSVLYHLWSRDLRKGINILNIYVLGVFWSHESPTIRENSIKRVKDILMKKIVDDKYGLGNVRSIENYWLYAGADINTQMLLRKHEPWTLPLDFKELKDQYYILPENEDLEYMRVHF